jgi:hypothetical protein
MSKYNHLIESGIEGQKVASQALLILMNNKNRRLKKDKRNLECTNYNFKNLAMLTQISFRICVFCKVKGHVIIECPLINNAMKDGFVRYMGQ